MDKLEDFSDRAVPENEGPRFNALYLFNVETAVTVCVPVFLFGASLGTSLGGQTFLITLFLSALCLAALAGWSSYIGVKTRLSTPLLVRGAFGKVGSHIVWAILGISLFGWFGVQTEIFSKAFLALLGEIDPSISLNAKLVTFLSGLIMSTTAIIGIKGVGKLSQISVPLLLLVLGYSFYQAFNLEAFLSWLSFKPENPASTGAIIASIIGAYSIGVIVLPDIKRFALNKKHAIAAGVSSIGFFYPLLLLMTALVAFFTHEADLMRVFINQGFGHLALIILMLATWTTNDANLYSASLNIAPFFPKLKRHHLAALSGLIGSTIATFGLFEHMIALFSLLGIFAAPILTIYSVCYLTHGFEKKHNAPMINSAALSTWALSSFIGLSTTGEAQFGLEIFTLTSVPVLDSLIASLLIYGFLYLTLSRLKKGA